MAYNWKLDNNNYNDNNKNYNDNNDNEYNNYNDNNNSQDTVAHNWRLVIQSAQERDTASYLCQVIHIVVVDDDDDDEDDGDDVSVYTVYYIS